jgi:hypothetical protein
VFSGLLFQEHVAELLQLDVGPEWEEAMLEAADESLQGIGGQNSTLQQEKRPDERQGIEDLTIHVESDDSDLHDDSDFTS